MGEVLRINGIRPKLFVEPFAGGAAVSLHVLQSDLVDHIGIGERDPLLASFWHTVFYDVEWLIDKIQTTAVTLETWKSLKAASLESRREKAFACLFLNRTSFSGILSKTAGPLGGWEQKSKYKIHCRYYKETIVKRIRELAALKSRVAFVREADWSETISLPTTLGVDASDVFYYLDPPFYNKAARLYRFFFGQDDHQALRDVLVRLKANWLLSYDPAEAIVALYSCNGSTPKRIELLYTVGGNGLVVTAEELIISNVGSLPQTIGKLSAEAKTAESALLSDRKDSLLPTTRWW